MYGLDLKELTLLCALIEEVNDQTTYEYLLDILKLTVEKYAKELKDGN